jgi:flagellar hook-associated protein 1 FlgK
MSFLTIFDIGKSALFASQTQLNVTSNNIANANTPGYSRQGVILEVANPITQGRQQFVGQGVTVAGIRRQYDAVLQSQINQAQQENGKSTTLSQNLGYIEQIFNEAQDLGLGTPLTDFFNAWQELANNPQGLTERSLLLQKATSLVNSAQSMEQGITNTLNRLQAGIIDSVSQINSLGDKIAQLNGQIAQVEAGSNTGSANDLRDQRDQALRDLNNLVETSSWEDPNNGALTVTIGMKNLVSGNTTNTLSGVYDQDGNYTLRLDGQDVTSKITKGEVGGLLTARQDIEADLHDLRKLVASITLQVNQTHVQGFDLDGNPGSNFFNSLQISVQKNSAAASLIATFTDDPPQVTLDEYTVKFNAGKYEVYDKATGLLQTSGNYDPLGTTFDYKGIHFVLSGAVTDQDSFTISPLTTAIQNFGTAVIDPREIAAAGTAISAPGDNANALALAGLMDSKISTLNSDTFANYYQTLVGQVGSQSKAASDGLTFSNNFLTQLNNQRDSVSGVNMDEEAANLVRFQRAYEAAARLIQTADTIFQDLLNLVGS